MSFDKIMSDMSIQEEEDVVTEKMYVSLEHHIGYDIHF